MKKYYLTFLLSLSAISIFAADIKSKLDDIYSDYGRPAAIGLAVLIILIGGVQALPGIRAGGEEAKKAAASWGFMAIWPVIILAVIEILIQILK